MGYHPIGQVCPPESRRPPQRDPCSVSYVVDLPILGEEEVEVPVRQLSQDFMASVTRQLPQHLPQIFADLQPHIDQVKAGLFEDANLLIQDTLEDTIRPEIESQKVELLSDINREANKALVTLGIITITMVGAVGLATWYTTRRVRG